MSRTDPNQRLKREIADYSVATIIDCDPEAPLGFRTYTLSLWDWLFQFTPSTDYPFKTPEIQYKKPGDTKWTKYKLLSNNTTSAFTMETLAIHLHTNIPLDTH